MPDWLSHILFALIIIHLFSVKKKSLVLLGSIFPDLIGKLKMFNYLFSGSPDWLIPLSNFWHTPLPSLLAVLFVSLFFSCPYLKTVLLIFAGDASHFLADGTTKSFLWQGYLPLLWADQYYWAILFFALVYGLILYFDIKLIRDKNEGTITTN